jgi:hypothetical protein
MDVHKENILTVSVSGESGTVMARWETPNSAKGKEPRPARSHHINAQAKLRALRKFV